MPAKSDKKIYSKKLRVNDTGISGDPSPLVKLIAHGCVERFSKRRTWLMPRIWLYLPPLRMWLASLLVFMRFASINLPLSSVTLRLSMIWEDSEWIWLQRDAQSSCLLLVSRLCNTKMNSYKDEFAENDGVFLTDNSRREYCLCSGVICCRGYSCTKTAPAGNRSCGELSRWNILTEPCKLCWG